MLRTGLGRFFANLRENSNDCKRKLSKFVFQTSGCEFSGILEVGEPNKRVLDVPIERDHLGIVVHRGDKSYGCCTGIWNFNRYKRDVKSNFIQEMSRIEDVY